MLIDDVLNQAYQLYAASQPDQAEQLCHQILSTDPERAEAVYLLAVIDSDAGRDAAAANGFAQAVALQPANPVFQNTLGETLHRLNRLDEAWDCYQRSLQLRPTYERAHNNAGRLLNQRGDQSGAVACFNEAVRLNPNYATALNNLGGVLLTSGDRSAAVPYLQRALACQPNYPEAHYNLASVFQADGEINQALKHLDQALRIRPNYPRAHLLLGKVLFEMGQVERSLIPFQTVVRLQPADAVGHFELGTVQLLLNQLEAAKQSFTAVLEIDPGHKNAFAQLCRVNELLMDWTTRDADLARLERDVESALAAGESSPIAPLHALSMPWTGELILRIARNHARSYETSAASLSSTFTSPVARADAVPLKIAYLSRDFYDHPVAHQIKGIFTLHDRARFDVHVYSWGPNDGSDFRRQIEQNAAHFHDVSGLNEAELYQRICGDEIQILIDLMGYTGFARTRCVAARPAPIQVNWLGFPSTMGAKFIDYLISDPVVTPPDHEHLYQEAIIRLPDSYMPTVHRQPVATPGDREQFGLPPEVPVFCCFNNSYKITPQIFQTWMSLLRRLPDAVVWLNINHPVAQENLRQTARRSGIDENRLIFASHVPDKTSHVARLALADLFLDAPLYNAHSTGCDALWAGLPIVTCSGQTFQSRVAASLLTAAGLPGLIAQDLTEYEHIVVELISDRTRLNSLREHLINERQRMPLFDTPRFVRNLERAFQRMWEIHRAGQSPQGFSL